MKYQSTPSSSNTFDITRHVRLVPPFDEKDADQYFNHFENVAQNLKWPEEY